MFALATASVLNDPDDASPSTDYNEWLERKVQASLDGLANGSNRTFTAAEWDAIRATRLAKRKGS
ncbi:MAG: hypothetical protein RL748_2142 [Pseudomonadota bacterium]|jgi:hypothetical protein